MLYSPHALRARRGPVSNGQLGGLRRPGAWPLACLKHLSPVPSVVPLRRRPRRGRGSQESPGRTRELGDTEDSCPRPPTSAAGLTGPSPPCSRLPPDPASATANSTDDVPRAFRTSDPGRVRMVWSPVPAAPLTPRPRPEALVLSTRRTALCRRPRCPGLASGHRACGQSASWGR